MEINLVPDYRVGLPVLHQGTPVVQVFSPISEVFNPGNYAILKVCEYEAPASRITDTLLIHDLVLSRRVRA